MKRIAVIIGSIALATSLAGCGNGSTGGGGGGDMATSVGKVDMAMMQQGPVDMAVAPQGALTGEPCTKDLDCQRGAGGVSQKGICKKQSGTQAAPITWPGGFCTSTCRAGRDDDCPGVKDQLSTAICDGNTKACEIPCTDHTTDCRADYICANIGSEGGLCIPAAASGCDASAPAPGGCPMGQSCVSYSPDESYGQCEANCDVFKQDCMPDPNGGTFACIADTRSAQMNCVNTINDTNMDGAPCRFLNECAPGLACHTENQMGVCRQYCGGAGMKACPGMQKCVSISPPMAMPQIPTTTVGICAP